MQTNNHPNNYLLDLSREEMGNLVMDFGLEAYRADQIFRGLYVQKLSTLAALTTLSKSLRDLLEKNTVLRTLKLAKTTESQLDGTTKFLWTLHDGLKIESVIIYEGPRVTFCISSQVGCALDCKFCATGRMGFLRNLSSGEIVEQVLLMMQQLTEPASNIVFMGMGEPLLNMKNVLKAAHVLSDPEGLAYSRKKITLSTSGVAPAIRKLADLNSPFSLAVSLNAVFETKRQKIMPVSADFPLVQLINEIRYYVSTTAKRVTFEYIMIEDFNDSKADAEMLIKLTSKIPCKINLIPCNSTDIEYPPSSNERIKWFADYLHDRGRTVTVRLRKGWEIQAACGQLYSANETKVGRKISDTGKKIKTS
jgi:23S rRNA (adenine2503-C2)-methyltransferase